MAEHSIRVSARGEFGLLRQGLRNLRGDLRTVLGEIDKGARRGGIFDEAQLRALDIFRERFKQSMREVEKEFNRQNDIIERLHRSMEGKSRYEQEQIRKEIREREKKLDVLRRELIAMEDLYNARNKEAQQFEVLENQNQRRRGFGLGGGGFGGRRSPISMLSSGFGWLFGLAGIGSLFAMGAQAYQLAHEAQTRSLDLAQRLRGRYGWGGDGYSMWNRASEVGLRYNMGYQAQETWAFLDAYTREAGAIGTDTLERMLMFGRAYGLQTGELAASISSLRQLGAPSEERLMNMIAGSVEYSGMVPRILEVMETSAGLLATINTTLKDNGAQQILAYQTVLDRIGMENNMMRLTGAQGASIISGFAGIFSPGSDDTWKWLGIRALQRYRPDVYGNMDLYALERAFEDGLVNLDNMPAMFSYLREQAGGNVNLMKRMVQRWLQSGGYNATKRQVDELYEVTGGFTVFNEESMRRVESTLNSVDSTARYQERMYSLGQQLLQTDAEFLKELENFGQNLVPLVEGIKSDFTDLLKWLNNNETIKDILQGLSQFIQDNWKYLASGAALLALGRLILGGLAGLGGMLLRGLLGRGIGGRGPGGGYYGGGGRDTRTARRSGRGSWLGRAGRAVGRTAARLWPLGLFGGAIWLSELEQERAFADRQTILDSYTSQYGLTDEELAREMQKRGLTVDMLRAGIADPRVAQFIEDLHRERQARLGKLYDNANERSQLEEALRQRYGGGGTSGSYTPIIDGVPVPGTGYKAVFGNVDLEELFQSGKTNFSNLYEAGALNFRQMTSLVDEDLDEWLNIAGSNFTRFTRQSGATFDEFLGISGRNLDRFYLEGVGYMQRVFEEHEGFRFYFRDIFKDVWVDFVSALAVLTYNSGGTYYGMPGEVLAEDGFWKNWQSRITSRFGASRDGGRRTHTGLDIAGRQGDLLTAIASGTIEKVIYDDGSARDPDRRANTTSGGSTVIIRMDDGRMYSYSHLSAINPLLQPGMRVTAGTWVGNVGGAPGAPGSGYSTTGAHLHLGYYDSRGNPLNPELLLREIFFGSTPHGYQRAYGNADIAQLFGVSSYTSSSSNYDRVLGRMDENLDRLVTHTIERDSKPQEVVVREEKTITLKIIDEKGTVNSLTEAQLRRLIHQVIGEREDRITRGSPYIMRVMQ